MQSPPPGLVSPRQETERPLGPGAVNALGLTMLAIAIERFASFAARLPTHSFPDGASASRFVWAGTLVGLIIGALLAYARGGRFASLVGAGLAALFAMVCLAHPGTFAVTGLAVATGLFRLGPISVVAEEIPRGSGRFRRVAAASAFLIVASDLSSFLTSLVAGVLLGSSGARPLLALATVAFLATAILTGLIWGLGARRFMAEDPLTMELVPGDAQDPYRGGPVVRTSASELPLSLVGAVFGFHLLEALTNGFRGAPLWAGAFDGLGRFGGMSGFYGGGGLLASALLGGLLARGVFRPRSTELFGTGALLFGLGALFAALGPHLAGATALSSAGALSVAFLGIGAFATAAVWLPRRLVPVAYALWLAIPLLVSNTLVPVHRVMPRLMSTGVGLLTSLACVAAGVALLKVGKRLLPSTPE